jgi:hypothetical protein
MTSKNALPVRFGAINTEDCPTPRNLVAIAKPKRVWSLAYWLDRMANRHYDFTLKAKPQPSLKESAKLMTWKSWTPATHRTSSMQVTVAFTVADVAAEEEGRLIRLGRYAFFSDKRAKNAAACSGAHSRFVAMHRTAKRKIGLFKGMTDSHIKRANKAKSAFDTAKQQVALLEKFLKQKYKGKRKITNKQKAEAAELLLVQQMRAKRAEKRYKKWQKAASF